MTAAEKFVGEKPAFAVELNLLDIGDRLDCAAIVRAYATGQILRALRYTVAGGETGRQPSGRKGVESSAAEIAAAIWDTLAYPHSHRAGAAHPRHNDAQLVNKDGTLLRMLAAQ
jgi:hypothetical protein